jgi:hypothetical protein
MLHKRRAIGVKLESTYRTDTVPTAADNACRVEDLSWSFSDVRRGERVKVSSFGQLGDVRAGEMIEISCMVPIMGSGSAGVAGEADAILQMAGLDPTVVSSTSVTYAMIESGVASASVYVWEDGKLIKLIGCRATLTGNLALSDSYGRVQVTIKGHIKEDQTDVAYPALTFDDVVPVALKGLTGLLLAGAYVPDVGAITFDLGNQLSVPDSMFHSDGYGEITLTDASVSGTFDPLDTLVATQNWMSAFRTGASVAFTTGVIGSSAGNRFAISASAINYRELSPGERNGLKSNSIGFHAPDGITIAFT